MRLKKLYLVCLLAVAVTVNISCSISRNGVAYNKIDDSDYFYEQLNGQEQTLYNALLTNTTTADNTLQLTFNEEISDVAHLQKLIQNVWDSIRRDKPTVYGLAFDDTGLTYSVKEDLRTVSIEHVFLDQALPLKESFNDKVSEYFNTETKTDKECVLALANEAKSKWNYVNATDFPHNTAYGVLENKCGNCYGISLAFKVLCENAGIPCIVVSGTNDISKQNLHAWNYVQLDNGYFYLVDVTYHVVTDTPVTLYGSIGKFKDKRIGDYYTPNGNVSQMGTKRFKYPIISFTNA